MLSIKDNKDINLKVLMNLSNNSFECPLCYSIKKFSNYLYPNDYNKIMKICIDCYNTKQKKCTECNNNKEYSEYSYYQNCKDSFKTICRTCINSNTKANAVKYSKEYYENHKTSILQAQKNYYIRKKQKKI